MKKNNHWPKHFFIDGHSIKESRVLMEVHIGRKLTTDENVHHKNGNPFDNRIENLEILSRREHTLLHNTIAEVNRKGLNNPNKMIPPDDNLSWCAHHKAFLPKSKFWRNKSRWDGYHSICKECAKIRDESNEIPCPICHGAGATTDHHDPCTECGGSGKVGGGKEKCCFG